MNELEQELRELLETKSRESRIEPRAPRKVLRRARRRQAGVALATAVTVAAVVIGSIAGLSAILGPSPSQQVAGGTDARTATIAGVTVMYPAEWTMVDLWPLSNSIVVSSGPTTNTGLTLPSGGQVPSGIPVFQLSNHDLGLTSACTGTAPAGDQALLYVAMNGGPYLVNPDGSPKWSSHLTPGDGPCGQGLYAYRETTTANLAAPYLVFAGLGPDVSEADRQAVFEAFDSLSFAWIQLEPPAETTPGYVLDAVRLGGLDCTLEGRPAADGGLEIALVYGRQPEAGRIDLGGVGRPGDPDVQYSVSAWSGLTAYGGSGDLGSVVFGVVSERVARVEARIPGAGTFVGTIVPIPSSLGSAYRAFHIEVFERAGGSLVALDADGNVIAEEPLAPAEPTSAPAPLVAPEDEAKSWLRNALAAALTYYTDGGTFVGFDPKQAVTIEPSLAYNTSRMPVEGEITIRDVTDTTILLVTQDANGSNWCLADDTGKNGGTTYGGADAQTVAECSGDISTWG